MAEGGGNGAGGKKGKRAVPPKATRKKVATGGSKKAVSKAKTKKKPREKAKPDNIIEMKSATRGRTAEQVRADNSALKRKISTEARDIGEIPDVVNPARRKRCELNLEKFLRTYFPEQFQLKFSPDHLAVIKALQDRAINGGLQAYAMPRGTGKTTISECATVWVVLYGHRHFPMLIGASEAHAKEMLDSIKAELETNELLLEDFPEVIYPVQALEGISHRARAQTCMGERTYIGWTADSIVMPTIPGSKASGVVIKVAGITGRVRGAKFKRSDGSSSRPDFVILDDPQTDESARSVAQSQAREAIIAGAVLGLAGPGKKIAGLMPCTVIRPGDMCDRILDRDRNPEWSGIRTKMMLSFPSNQELWEEYEKLRKRSLREKEDISLATAFYKKNRKKMDVGAEVSWKERYNHDELSAIQHAMNLKFRDNAAFWAEYQNEPLPDDEMSTDDMTPDIIMSRLSGLSAGVVPDNTNWLTAFCDVQQSSLWWAVVAWSDKADATVIDYGTYPENRKHYFTLRDMKTALADKFPKAGLDAQIFSGLDKLCSAILRKRWRRTDGSEMTIDRMLIDAGFKADVIYDYCQKSPFSALLMPSYGRAVKATENPMNDWKRKRGERVGESFRITKRTKHGLRSVMFETNFWKSWIEARVMTAPGDMGSFTLYGKDPDRHSMIADHMTAEYKVRNTARGRTVDQWQLKPSRDNHWFDAIVGSAVAAAMQGMPTLVGNSDASVKMGSGPSSPLLTPKKAKLSFAALQRAAKQKQKQKR